MSSPATFAPWYAIQTKPRHEKVVVRQLEYKGYQPFLPTYQARRRWSDRIKIVEMALFEGYFFCRVDPGNTARVITTPGATRIVSVCGTPLPVCDEEIEALQQLVAARRELEPWPYLRVGQRVRIETGSLTGIEGILQGFRNQWRVIVSVTLLQRSVAVEIHPDAVSCIEPGVLPPTMMQ